MYLSYSPLSFRADIGLAHEEERLDLALLAPRYRNVIQRIKAMDAKPIRELRKACIKGKTPAASDYTAKGVPVVKVGTVTDVGDLDWEKASFIPDELYQDAFVDVTLQQEDIVVVATGKGSIGKVAIFTEQQPAIIVGENCLVRCDSSRIDPYYLTAFLLTKYGWVQLDAYPLGPSGQTHLYPRQIDKILVPIPRNASEIASKYRRSVELKKQAQHINTELQELFDNYIARYYAPTISISSSVALSSCVSEKRLDPGFWSARLKALLVALSSSQEQFIAIRELAGVPIHRGVQPEYNDNIGTVPVLKTVDVQNRKVNWAACRRVTEEFFKDHPRAQLRRNDIVITSTGEGSWGRAAICDIERALADGHLTILRVNADIVDSYAVLAFLWSEYGLMQFEQRVRGSTGQTEIYPQDIEKIKVLIPTENDQRLIARKIQEQFALLDETERLRRQAIQDIEDLLGGVE